MFITVRPEEPGGGKNKCSCKTVEGSSLLSKD